MSRKRANISPIFLRLFVGLGLRGGWLNRGRNLEERAHEHSPPSSIGPQIIKGNWKDTITIYIAQEWRKEGRSEIP